MKFRKLSSQGPPLYSSMPWLYFIRYARCSFLVVTSNSMDGFFFYFFYYAYLHLHHLYEQMEPFGRLCSMCSSLVEVNVCNI